MMIGIWLDPPANKRFNVDRTIQLLSRKFRVLITAENSFAAERAKVLAAAKELALMGRPLNDPSVITGSIERKEQALGPGKNVIVSMDNDVQIEGRAWATSIRLRSYSLGIDSTEVAAVVQALRDLGLGEARTWEWNNRTP